MNRLKRVFVSFSLFFTNMITKVYAVSMIDRVDILYGVVEPEEPTIVEKIVGIGNVLMPIILFVIGLFVVLSKKLTKKVKTIIISSLIILGVLVWAILNYFADMI